MVMRVSSLKACGMWVAMGALLVTAAAVGAQGAWEAPADAKKMKNPVAKSDKVVATAKQIFQTNCVACHGADGTGNGPAAASLPVKPANWTAAATQANTDGELFWKITNGRGPMPPWKHLSENDRWALVHYLRTFKKK